ncbi:MAG: glucosaminidase domain-containing protein [Mariprofundaceae bacterium]|nr:glucosaminidase domain-containing protein [Mariprofundaceae bacterium]
MAFCLLLISCAPRHVVHAPVSEKPAPPTILAEQQEVVEAETPAMVKKLAPRERKVRFFTLLRPLVKAENERILRLRRRVQTLSHLRGGLNASQLQEVQNLARTYRLPLSAKPDTVFWSRLLKRMDAVPLELALAQAANESAWGSSRFAREGNNYFGQWCYRKGCGLVPARRNVGAVHEVRVFAAPADSVRAYIRNLNTTAAYRQLRAIRLHLRRSGKPLDAMLLSAGLRTYSERGGAYVKSIRTMIRRNKSLMRAERSEPPS